MADRQQMPAVAELNMYEVCRTGEFISRILFSCLSARFGSFLFAINPERWLIPRNRPYTGRADVPYLILLQVGFALLLAITDLHGGLLHRPFTLTSRKLAVCFLWHFPLTRIYRVLPSTTPGHLALWSPDFPPVAALGATCQRPVLHRSDTLKSVFSILFVHKNRKLQSSFWLDRWLTANF